MRTLSEIEIIKLLREKEISLFTLSDFGCLLGIKNQNTLYKKVQRLKEKGIVKSLIKGRYLFVFKEPDEFTIANFLYQPSYVSLESALSFYGIITGFPQQITSLTTRKTKGFDIEGKEYQYTQITPDLFWGYEKKESFLIADPEKSLLDYLYLAFKGLRSSDLDEFDLSAIKRKKINHYFKMIKKRDFLKFLKRIKI